jgi:hypothetical protein
MASPFGGSDSIQLWENYHLSDETPVAPPETRCDQYHKLTGGKGTFRAIPSLFSPAGGPWLQPWFHTTFRNPK